MLASCLCLRINFIRKETKRACIRPCGPAASSSSTRTRTRIPAPARPRRLEQADAMPRDNLEADIMHEVARCGIIHPWYHNRLVHQALQSADQQDTLPVDPPVRIEIARHIKQQFPILFQRRSSSTQRALIVCLMVVKTTSPYIMYVI